MNYFLVTIPVSPPHSNQFFVGAENRFRARVQILNMTKNSLYAEIREIQPGDIKLLDVTERVAEGFILPVDEKVKVWWG